MPVKGLEDTLRIPRTFNIRLGSRVKKLQDGTKKNLTVKEEGGYPSETEYFVLDTDEVPKDIRELYGKEPKSIRLMLLTEYDEVDENGHEMTLSLNNRAWRRRGLRCFGHGRASDEADVAYTNDEEWALRIAQRAKGVPELLEGPERKAAPMPGVKVWRVPCLGQDCPKYDRKVEGVKDGAKAMVQAEGHDEDASCKVNIVLRAFLLHPDFGKPGKPGEREVLACVQLASGSYNAIVQLRSGFRLMKPFTAGRTAGIPFTLIRKPTTTYTPTRQVHFTLDILPTPSEWQRFATVPIQEIFLTDELREYRRLINQQPLGLEFDAVKDLYPTRRLTAPLPQAQAEPNGDMHQTSVAGSDNPSTEPVPAVTDAEDERTLTRTEVTDLRRMFGTRTDPDGPDDDVANPFPQAVNDKFKAAMTLYNEKHGKEIKRFSEITVHAAEFLKHIAEGQP